MKKQPRLSIIKPVLGTTGVSDTDFLARLNAVHDAMLNNPAYPSPPVDMAGFKTSIDSYYTATVAALDGGKAALTELEKRRADVTVMYRLLGHYVEATCKGDMNTFVSSGFVAAPKAQRKPDQPVDVPAIASLDQGSTGQLLATLKEVPGARLYDIRFAPAPVPGAVITWTTIAVAKAKAPVQINYLTPGTSYTFQVRAFGNPGFSDWSDPATRMCI
jgi:hypothetical protein